MKWTPELDNRIAGLLRAKKTAAQIGAEMGVTRNSIIGRVTRCKMLKAIGFAPKSGEKTTDGPKRPRRRLASVKPIVILPAPKKPEPLAEPHHVGRPLDMLPACRCKFAITPHDAPKDAHLFCGEVTEPGKSWCAWHEQIVWGRGTAGETATVKSAERLAA